MERGWHHGTEKRRAINIQTTTREHSNHPRRRSFGFVFFRMDGKIGRDSCDEEFLSGNTTVRNWWVVVRLEAVESGVLGKYGGHCL
jgi:hypothetical protein